MPIMRGNSEPVAQAAALSRPAQAAAILRHLTSLAERLCASPPSSNEDMEDICAQLGSLRPLIRDGTAAPALLSNAAARTALLNLLSVALRQRLDDSGLSAYSRISYEASSCCVALLCCKLPLLHAKRRLSFALRLVRTQPLQCCARRLAEVGPALLSLGRGLQQRPPGVARGRASGSGAARAQLSQRQVLLMDEASNAFTQSLHLVQGLFAVAFGYEYVDGRAPTPSERGPLQQELIAALRDSCMLEHAARTLLLQLQLPCEGPPRAHMLFDVVGFIELVASSDGPEEGAVAPPAGSELTDVTAALRGLLSGRCLRHAALVLGVAALRAADGGPAYGLPSELLRRVPVLGRRLGPDGEEVGPPVDSRHEEGWTVLNSRPLNAMLRALRCRARGALPDRCGTLALLVRVCRLVVASGRAHMAMRGESKGVVEADGTAARWLGCGSSSSTRDGGSGRGGGGGRGGSSASTSAGSGRGYGGSGSGSGSGGGGGSCRGADSGSSGGGGDGMGGGGAPLPLLRQDDLPRLFSTAMEDAIRTCFPATPAERLERAAARAECWRLFAAYTAEVLPLGLTRLLCSPARQLKDPGPLVPGAPLPASPPPSWEDALAGGWLPCLERLLRLGGEDPGGPEASLAVTMIATMGDDDDRDVDSLLAWRHLAVLLAYGEPRQAAALVVTLGKLLCVAEPALMAGIAPKGHNVTAVAVLWALTGASQECEAADVAAASGADEEGEGRAQGGLPRGEQSAAGRQLALMLSCALCEWLPPLSRVAMRAMEAAALLTGQPHPAQEAEVRHLLYPLLWWLPVLAQRCCTPVGGEAGTDGVVAMTAGGTAGTTGGPRPKDCGGCDGTIGGGWRQLLLEEVGAVPLLGAALGLLTGAPKAAADDEDLCLRWLLVWGCCFVAVACPEEVRAAVKAAATASQLRFPWRPQQLRALAGRVRKDGDGEEAEGAEVLAALLEVWEGGGGEDGEEATTSQAEAEVGMAGVRAQLPLGAAWQRVKEWSTQHEYLVVQCAAALVPVAEARGVLPQPTASTPVPS